jgi:tripartite-type tricarboxylate transporter receptor subunit TctC
MKIRRRQFLHLAAGATALSAVSRIARAQAYPSRPVRFICAFPAGGPNDIATRVMADWFSADLGQQFVVENRGGSGGNLGTQAMINSPRDGYTLLLVAANNAISASLYKRLSFDFIRDTVPVAGVMRFTNIMVVPPSLPVQTVSDFIAYAKANPGKVSFASSGNGTAIHMSGELFKSMTGIDMVHVPYRGSAGVYPDLMTGKVHVLFDNLPGSIEFVRAGQLRALGVTAAKRWDALPEVPAIAETVAGYEVLVWYGISAPKGTPPGIVAALNKSVATALADPKINKRLTELGGVPMPMSPTELGKLIADETKKWAEVVKFAKITRWSEPCEGTKSQRTPWAAPRPDRVTNSPRTIWPWRRVHPRKSPPLVSTVASALVQFLSIQARRTCRVRPAADVG